MSKSTDRANQSKKREKKKKKMHGVHYRPNQKNQGGL